MSPFYIYKAIGIPFTIFFMIIAFYILYTFVKLYGETPKNASMDWVGKLLPLDNISSYSSACVDSCIDRVWQEYETNITQPISSIGGCVNAAVLIGFFGTILGAILAFKDMGSFLSSDGADLSVAIQSAFNGGLNTALVTSLLSSIIGGLSIGVMAVIIQPRVKKYETRICAEICSILKKADSHVSVNNSEPGG